MNSAALKLLKQDIDSRARLPFDSESFYGITHRTEYLEIDENSPLLDVAPWQIIKNGVDELWKAWKTTPEEPIAVAATTELPVLDEDTSGGAADNGRPPHKRKDNH